MGDILFVPVGGWGVVRKSITSRNLEPNSSGYRFNLIAMVADHCAGRSTPEPEVS